MGYEVRTLEQQDHLGWTGTPEAVARGDPYCILGAYDHLTIMRIAIWRRDMHALGELQFSLGKAEPPTASIDLTISCSRPENVGAWKRRRTRRKEEKEEEEEEVVVVKKRRRRGRGGGGRGD